MVVSETLKKFRPGIILGLLSAFCFSTSSALAVYATPKIGLSNMTGIRYAIQGFLYAPVMLIIPEELYKTRKRDIVLILMSGFAIAVGTIGVYASLLFIPIMDATVLLNTQPIVVLIISGFWLKERIRYLEIIMSMLVVIGVVLVSQPTFIFGVHKAIGDLDMSMTWVGYLFGVVACLGLAFTLCILRKVQDTDATVTLMLQSIVVVGTAVAMAFFTNDQKDPITVLDWVYVLGASFTDILARIFATYSVKYEESNLLAVIQTTEIPFSLIFQIWIFKICPNVVSILGVALITIAVLSVTFREKYYAIVHKSSTKSEKLKFSNSDMSGPKYTEEKSQF